MVYSIDLRKKAIEYIQKGGNRTDASKIFGVTTRTLSNWIRREQQQDLAPRMKGSNPSKIDNEKLKQYVKDHPDSYLREIAKAFHSSVSAVFYACQRLKITLKKRCVSTEKGMKGNEKNF